MKTPFIANRLSFNGLALSFLFTFLILGLANSVYGQCGSSWGVNLYYQSDIDNFSINYPNCNSFYSLTIGGQGSTITNLNGLSQLDTIYNDLTIQGTQITNLIGLENLDYVGDEFIIRNSVLVNFNGLGNPSFVEDLRVQDNHNIINLEGLEGISNLRLLSIGNNNNLLSIDGLEGLVIGQPNGNSASHLHCTFINNPLLENIDGMINYTGSCQLSVIGNPVLTNLNGLNNAAACHSSFNIENNPLLEICHNDWICEILIKEYANPNFLTFANNAPGCNSTQEVQDQCITTLEDFQIIDTTIYFCAATSYEFEGTTYFSDTTICENVQTNIFLGQPCYDIVCTQLRTTLSEDNCQICFDQDNSFNSWTQVGDDVVIANNRIEFQNDAVCGQQRRVYKNIGTDLDSSDTWSVDVDFHVTSAPGNAVAHFPIALKAGTEEFVYNCPDINCSGYPPFTQDIIAVGFITTGPFSGDRAFSIFGGEGDTGTTTGIAVADRIPATTTDQTYYLRLERCSETNITLGVYSDANRTTHVPSSPVKHIIPNSISGLNTLQVGVDAGGFSGRRLNGWVDNICLSSEPTIPSFCSISDTTICEGESVEFYGLSYSTDTLVCMSYPAFQGCDSTICLNLTIEPNILTSEMTYICQGAPLENTPSTSETLTAFSGCDSIHTINYVVADTFYNTTTAMICEGESYDFNGQIYTTDVTVCQDYSSFYGCDSTECLVLDVADALVIQSTETICEGESYNFDGIIINSDTTLCITYSTGPTCDSTHCLTLTVLDSVLTNTNQNLCQGELFAYGNNSTTTDATLCADFTAYNGCDSTHCIAVSFLDTMYVSEMVTICPGETYSFNGNSLSNDTLFCVTNLGTNGCDSTYCLQLSLLETPSTAEDIFICAGEVFNWNNNDYTSATLLCDTLDGSNGCDSFHCIQLSVLDTFYINQQENICAGESYIFDGNTLTTDTSLCITYTAFNGCDSTHCVAVSMADSSLVYLNPTICDGEVFPVGNSNYSTTGVYTDVLTAFNGCDSTVVTTLNVFDNPGADIMVGADICEGAVTTLDAGAGYTTYDWSTGASTQSIETGTAGVYSVIVSDNNGCTTEASINFGGPVSLQSNTIVTSNYNGFDISCAASDDGAVENTISGGSEPYGFEWSTGASTATLNNLPSGTYSLTITDNNNCTTTDQITLTAPPVIAIDREVKQPDCFEEENGAIILTPLGSTLPYSYHLSDRIPQTSGLFNQLAAGNYTLTITDVNGCEREENITIPSPPSIALSVSPTEATLQLGDSIVIEAFTSATLESIRWSPAIYISCDTCLSNTITPFESINYQITAMDTSDCIVTEEISLRVQNERLVYIPNAFSPNGDGINDFFMPYTGTGVERILNFSIFNRWGKTVFEVEDFVPNDPGYAWGKDLNIADQVGLYVYYVEVRYVNGETEIFKGEVNVLR